MAYLFCVLEPTISFALPGGHANPYCLTDDDHVPGMVHVHHEGMARHGHKVGHVHDHSGIHSHVHEAGDHHVTPVAVNGGSVPAKGPHSSDGQCCGLMCVTALPATLVDVAKPSVPKALCEAGSYRKLTDNAPPRLYRPPIS